MKIKNINKKLKKNKEKTEVLGGRISSTKMVAFSLIAEALEVSTADLFKATIDECIEEYFKSMIKIDIKKADRVVQERIKKFQKKNSVLFMNHENFTSAEVKINEIAHIKEDFPEEIPVFWFFDEIQLDFSKEEKLEKDRYLAYKNYLDEIYSKTSEKMSQLFDEIDRQNEEDFGYLKEAEDVVIEYHALKNSGAPIPKELQSSYDSFDPKLIRSIELVQYPFLKNEDGEQKYSDQEIVQAFNSRFGQHFKSIQDVHDYAENMIEKQHEDERNFQEKLKVIKGNPEQYTKKDFENMETDPFCITSESKTKQKFSDEMIVRYWKHYMKDIEYFSDKEITSGSIKSYSILRHDKIL